MFECVIPYRSIVLDDDTSIYYVQVLFLQYCRVSLSMLLCTLFFSNHALVAVSIYICRDDAAAQRAENGAAGGHTNQIALSRPAAFVSP